MVNADMVSVSASSPSFGIDPSSIFRRVWQKVIPPLAIWGGVCGVIAVTVWLATHSLMAGPLMMMALLALLISVDRFGLPGGRIYVHWTCATDRPPAVWTASAPAKREARQADFMAWTAILTGVTGGLLNGLAWAFGSEGLLFSSLSGSSALCFALICAGLYGRP